MLKDSDQGIKIGPLTLNAVACADDIALFADNPVALQILLNYAYYIVVTYIDIFYSHRKV